MKEGQREVHNDENVGYLNAPKTENAHTPPQNLPLFEMLQQLARPSQSVR